MAETAVAMARLNSAVAEQKPAVECMSWTSMVWAELLAFVSRQHDVDDDPLFDRV
ncbi:MAG TPA: hypothetical protein VGL89_19955 [Candidatus Koribacter sp.]|jgi:hypothetical protein